MDKPLILTIKRFDTKLALPEYKTAGAAGFDLSARVSVTIPPQGVGYIPLNIAIQLPQGTWALLAARSSLHKKGLLLANGIGVGDYDYRGDADEYQAAILNFSQASVTVERGERIVQMIIVSGQRVNFIEKEKFEAPNRGGFGTTGKS